MKSPINKNYKKKKNDMFGFFLFEKFLAKDFRVPHRNSNMLRFNIFQGRERERERERTNSKVFGSRESKSKQVPGKRNCLFQRGTLLETETCWLHLQLQGNFGHENERSKAVSKQGAAATVALSSCLLYDWPWLPNTFKKAYTNRTEIERGTQISLLRLKISMCKDYNSYDSP